MNAILIRRGCSQITEPKIRSYNNNNNNNNNNTIRDNEKGTCMLIDVAISGDRNVIKKEAEKILKYRDLTIEIQRMWNVKNKGETSNNMGGKGSTPFSYLFARQKT